MKQNFLQLFGDSTSIHGVRYICGRKAKKVIFRLIWFAVFSSMLAMLTRECVLGVYKYLEFNVATSVTVMGKKGDLKYPAITVCNKNWVRRSIVGSNPLLLQILAKIGYSNTYKYEKLRIQQNARFCNSTTSKMVDLCLTGGFEALVLQLGLTAELSITKCWMNNKEIDNCHTYAYNHFTEDGVCFTINPQKQSVGFMKDLIGGAIENVIKNDTLFTVCSLLSKNGFKILLNVHQEEYCGQFFGPYFDGQAGFVIYVHDPGDIGEFHHKSPFLIKPGSSFNVQLNSVEYNRKTEWMGKCKSTLFKNVKVYEENYTQSKCFAVCYSKYIYEHCNCRPVLFVAKPELAEILLNIPKSSICKIHTGEIIRFIDKTIEFVKLRDTGLCNECLPVCFEKLYDYVITESVFPVKYLNDMFLSDNNEMLTYKDIQHNYVILNLQFQNKNVLEITEKQDYTLIDLMNSIGSA